MFRLLYTQYIRSVNEPCEKSLQTTGYFYSVVPMHLPIKIIYKVIFMTSTIETNIMYTEKVNQCQLHIMVSIIEASLSLINWHKKLNSFLITTANKAELTSILISHSYYSEKSYRRILITNLKCRIKL